MASPILLFLAILLFSSFSSLSIELDPTKIVQLSWYPRVFLYEDFLSYEECDHLVSFLAHAELEKSKGMIAFKGGTGSGLDKSRTNVGVSLSRDQDEIVTTIEKRIAAWTFLPEDNGEPLQILNHKVNEKYEAHHDYSDDSSNIAATGGHRVATVFMYLSNVSKGGETVFPKSEMKNAQLKDATWSECARSGYAVKPVKGNALLFFSLHLNGKTDDRSLHGDCPVLDGDKWSATKWIHVRETVGVEQEQEQVLPLPVPNDECTDEHNMCVKWAARGECERNPMYMQGTTDYYGACRKSCDVC